MHQLQTLKQLKRKVINMDNNNNAQAIAELVKKHIKPEIQNIKDTDGTEAQVLILPEGLRTHNIQSYLDENRKNPRRRIGTASFTGIDSLITHANRFKDEHSVLFASPDNSSITSVLDYHEKEASGLPRYGKHRGLYNFPLSQEWKKWKSQNGEKMEQMEFAEFIEDNVSDIIVPPDLSAKDLSESDKQLRSTVKMLSGTLAGPDKMISLSRGIQINEDSVVKSAHNLQSGEIQLQYETKHRDATGQALTIPNLFLIAVPVFENDELYRILIRLRYRKRGGGIMWFFEMYLPEKIMDDAFKTGCQKAQKETDLPLFFGSPE